MNRRKENRPILSDASIKNIFNQTIALVFYQTNKYKISIYFVGLPSKYIVYS